MANKWCVFTNNVCLITLILQYCKTGNVLVLSIACSKTEVLPKGVLKNRLITTCTTPGV